MEKSRNSEKESLDRLSALPDELIYEIFWSLPMKEVVRTTILSKRWNNLWNTTPNLNFFDHDMQFVNLTLILWKGSRILKFKFGRVGAADEKFEFSDIYVWMRLCSENGIEELYLEDPGMDPDDYRGELYSVTHSLYSCSSLKVLYLDNSNFPDHHGTVQWNQLRRLTIWECIFDHHTINQVVSGSPQLEVLILSICDLDESLSIRSCSLKTLSIERCFGVKTPSQVTELTIWSPNLETFELKGEAPYGKCLFTNVSSLTSLKLDFTFRCEKNVSGETLWKIFPTIQHVDKGLEEMKEQYSLSPLPNVKFLKIESYDTHYKDILDVLLIFPNLVTLVLWTDIITKFEMDRTSFLQVQRNLPESFLLQLRTVDILMNVFDESVLRLIEILLKHASKLQKMEIKLEGIKPPPLISLGFAQKLLRMPRSSPAAELTLVRF